jgi:hypothetical protein
LVVQVEISFLKSNAMQGVCIYDTIFHQLTCEPTSSLFIYSDILVQIDKWKQIYNLCFVKLQFRISEEKYEPGLGFESRTSIGIIMV